MPTPANMLSATYIARMFKGASVNRRIFRAAVSVSAVGILVKLVATFKEITVAGVYGRSDVMDAFLAAALIPGLLVNLISESMNQALVPTLIRVREQEGQDRAQQLLSSSMLWMCLLLGAVSAAMALAAHGFFPLIASHFPAAKLDLSIRLFYALLPVVLITGTATNCTAVLNTFDRFALPALAPVAISLAIIAGTLLLSGRFGIWAMVYSTLAGSLIHAAVVAWMMNEHGYRFRLRWYGMTEATREVARQYGPVLLSGVVSSSGFLVDQSMAAMLPAGSVSALVYANRFVSVVLTLMAGAVSTAVVPYFSRMIAHRDWAGCRHTLHTWIRLTALVSVPITVALVAGAHLLIRIALQHGAFGWRDTAVVTPVLAMYALQIPFYVTGRVLNRFLVAMRRTDLIFYCGALNLILDIVLNLILMRWFGVAGIALATSLWTVSSFLFLWCWTWRVLPKAAAETA
ncbi:MAG: murein biosynthesis integral membrane protein MurJ [Terracidiphilus sp.]|nr:murein biosynthesis integral membrane protein MurJ [Terracidiphilus sp.]